MNDSLTNRVSLTTDQVESLAIVERMIADLLPQLDSLEKCGKSCQAIRQQAVGIAEQARLLRQHFSPPLTS